MDKKLGKETGPGCWLRWTVTWSVLGEKTGKGSERTGVDSGRSGRVCKSGP